MKFVCHGFFADWGTEQQHGDPLNCRVHVEWTVVCSCGSPPFPSFSRPLLRIASHLEELGLVSEIVEDEWQLWRSIEEICRLTKRGDEAEAAGAASVSAVNGRNPLNVCLLKSTDDGYEQRYRRH